MSETIMVNARMDRNLKEQASQVLKRAGITHTQAMVGFYENLVKEQAVPDYLQRDAKDVNDEIQQKRKKLQSMVQMASSNEPEETRGKSDKEVWRKHLIEKYG